MTATSSRAGSKEWVGLAVLTVPALLASMDLSVLFMAAPWLSADLQPGGSQLLWIMDVYGFLMAGLLITMGTVGDRIGRRRLLMLGALAFGAASLLAAYSTSAEMLIAARALLGVGGATLAPSTLALIRNMFHDDSQRRTAVAIWAGAFSAGAPLGSIVGGLLVEHFWWGAVFLINIPVMALLLVLAPLLLPEYSDPEPGRFDLLGATLSMAAILPAIWGLKKLAEDGGTSVAAWAALLVGLLGGWLFLRRQRNAPAPLIDVSLFARPAFSASVGSNLVLTLASAGLGMLVVQHLQLVLGYRPVVAALWMVPMVTILMVGIAVGTAVVRWVRPGWVIAGGVGVAACGFGLLGRLSADDTIVTILTGYSTVGFGMGVALSLAYNLVLATAPPRKAGAAAAINEAGTELGGALGIAFLGSIATAAYHRSLHTAIPPGTPEAIAASAGSTLGADLAAAEKLSHALAEPFAQAAVEAFTDGIAVTSRIGAVLLVIAALIAAFTLRNVQLSEERPTKERQAGT